MTEETTTEEVEIPYHYGETPTEEEKYEGGDEPSVDEPTEEEKYEGGDELHVHFYISGKGDGKTSSKEDGKISGEEHKDDNTRKAADYGGYGSGVGGYVS